MSAFRPRIETLALGIIALMALFVHGYHLGSDDAAIYVPAIKKAADPGLYPFYTDFFSHHASLSFFPDLVGGSARITRLPIGWTIFLWHTVSIFLLLAAGRQLLVACFESERARWAGLVLLACVLTVPVAGTALVIMDPYLTARSISTPATLFAIACIAVNHVRRGMVWLFIAALVHPQMSVYGAAFLGCWVLARYLSRPVRTAALSPGIIPLSFAFEPARGIYRDILASRPYFLVSNWTWWEWLGVVAPVLMLWGFSRMAPAGTLPAFHRLSRTLVLFGLLFTVAGIVLATSSRFDNVSRLQPMRSFHLLYVVFFLFVGGLIGDRILSDRTWRWCVLFLPLAAAMWTVQAQAYPSSPHIEWPGASYRSGWLSAFVWIRDYTPKDAIFALDPNYFALPGVDQHGFRALAERSALADNLKDSGAVSVFPQLADRWKNQVAAQAGWGNFKLADYRRLAAGYGVDWLVLRRGQSVTGLVCPYSNDAVSVCAFSDAAKPYPTGAGTLSEPRWERLLITHEI